MTSYKPVPEIRFGVALLRVSTDKQFQEGESIENQRRKVEFVGRREKIDIVRFFTEHYSGRKSDRRVLDDLFQFLEANPDVTCVIVGDIDRFTRGGTEIYLSLKRRLRDLNVALIDTTGIIQPERNRLEHLGVEYNWSIESPSHYAEIFMAEKARAEASDILTRTIGQQIQLTREGYQCRGSNFGYQNQKITTEDGKKKTIMMAHPSEAAWIIRMFELKADGGWRDDAICEAVNAMGYGSRISNIYDKETRRVIGQTQPKKLDVKQLNKFISRTIYCGVKCERWNHDTPIYAALDPLISVALFNQANRGKLRIVEQDDEGLKIVEDRTLRQNHRHNPEFLLRHVVLCPECGKPFMASKSTGKLGKRHGYYHCARKHKRIGFSKSEFESTVANRLNTLQAKPGFLPLFREVVRDVWMQKTRAEQRDQSQVNEHVAALKSRQAALLEAHTAAKSQIVRDKLEDQIEELEATIEKTETHLKTSQIKEDEIDAYFAIAKKLMEHPSDIVMSAHNKEKIERYWCHIFRTPPTYTDLVDGTPDLTLIYRLNAGFPENKNLLAGQQVLEWNTFEREIEETLANWPTKH